MVRDILVEDSQMQTLLGVSSTGSAPVSPRFMERSGTYPQIIYSEIDGVTDPGMGAENGLISFSVQVQATGGQNPHFRIENILKRIEELFDDQSVSGASISGTSVYSFLFLREGGPEVAYNDRRKIYNKVMDYSYKIIQQ